MSYLFRSVDKILDGIYRDKKNIIFTLRSLRHYEHSERYFDLFMIRRLEQVQLRPLHLYPDLYFPFLLEQPTFGILHTHL